MLSSTEDEIAGAFADGERWAFEAAYRLYRDALYGAARAVLHDAGEAQDCVHDVFSRLLRRKGVYRAARGSLRAFLIVCVRNEALSRFRRDANRMSVLRTAAVQRHAEITHTAEDVVARLDAERLISRLNEPQQRAVRMAYFDALTHEDIARALGEPVGTIKSRLSLALRAMRAALKGGEYSDA